jgi:predicted transcriptional regulator
MASQVITLELPEDLYRTVNKLAQATERPLAEILRESLAHTLPPLDDVSADEADVLARMSTLDDSVLWQASKITLPEPQQEELRTLLDRQNAGELTPDNTLRLQDLMDEYGRLLVRRSHAWLLLARRGYRVPIQQQQE